MESDEGEGDEWVATSSEPLSAVSGTRSLAVVTLVPNGGLAHTSVHYKNKIFGDPNSSTDYSVVDYIQGVSRNKLTYKPMTLGFVWEFPDPGTSIDAQAGVVVGDEDNDGDDSPTIKIKRALYLLRNLTNIATYDKNGDGVIKPSELTLMVITPGSLGSARGVDVKISNTLRYTGKGVSMGDIAAGNTFAHELSHTVGTDDMYGNPSSGGPCNSARMTLMSCSYTTSNEGWFGLDPWHLRGLGWDNRTESQKVSWVTGAGTPSQRTGWAATVSPSTYVVIPSPTRNLEYYVLEWRDRTAAWDKNVAAQGVIAWYVAETSGGGILNIDSVTHTDSQGNPHKDKSNVTMAPTAGCLLDPWDATSRGRVLALTQGKSYALKWRDKSVSPSPIVIGTKDSQGRVSITSTTSHPGAPSCN